MKQIKVYITPEQWAEKRLQFMLTMYVQRYGRKLESIDKDIKLAGFELIESETKPEQPQPSEPPTDKVEAVKYFLNQLPSGYRERALAQVDEKHANRFDASKSISDAIMAFSEWSKTNEGRVFWLKVHNYYYDPTK